MAKILTVVGEGKDGEHQNFHIINPMNLVVHAGVITKPGQLKDGEGNPIPVEEPCTFVRVGGQPLFVKETVEEVYERAKAL